MSENDRKLRELFAQLKEADRARTPSFRAPATRAAPRRRPMVRVALAAAIVVVALVLARPDQTPRTTARLVDLGATGWRSPTDFLLNTPGSELLRSVPAVGSPDDWTPISPRGGVPAAESTRRTPS